MMMKFLIFALFISVPTVYGDIQDEVKEGIQNVIDQIIDGVYDGVMGEVEIPKNDFINPTDAEMENLKDEGKEWLNIFMDLLGQSHRVAESGVYVASDYDLDPWIVAVISIVVVGIVAIPMLKKTGIDMMKILLISVSFVVVFAVVGLVF